MTLPTYQPLSKFVQIGEPSHREALIVNFDLTPDDLIEFEPKELQGEGFDQEYEVLIGPPWNELYTIKKLYFVLKIIPENGLSNNLIDYNYGNDKVDYI